MATAKRASRSRSEGFSQTLWHSELVKLTAAGPILVFVKTGAQESQHPNKPPYAVLVIEERERYYNIETQEIAEQLNAHVDQRIYVSAGGRDAQAFLSIPSGAEADGEQEDPPRDTRPARPAPPQRPAPRPQQRPPAQRPQGQTPVSRSQEDDYQEAVNELKRFATKQANALYLCRLAVRKVHKDAMAAAGEKEPPMSEDCEQKLATTIFIAADRKGMNTGLPSKNLANYTDL